MSLWKKVIRSFPHVFTLLEAASEFGPVSSFLRFLSLSSSREKLGPVCADGVGNVRGLGSMLLSGPVRPKPHSGKKLDGEGKRASDTKRLGNAETGVSILLLLAYAVLFCAAPAVVPGGGGLANGFGGPCAPALRMAPADGDGGGRTTPGGLVSELPLAGVCVLFPAESRADDSPVALPRSEFSLGICTVSFGRPAAVLEFVRVGGLDSELAGIDFERTGADTGAAAAADEAAGGTDTLDSLASPDDSFCNDSAFTVGSVRGDSHTCGTTPK